MLIAFSPFKITCLESTAAQEAAHERRSRPADHPDPEPLFRTCAGYSRTSWRRIENTLRDHRGHRASLLWISIKPD